MSRETWQLVPFTGYDYMVSDLGRVKSINKFRKRYGYITRGSLTYKGYLRTTLSNQDKGYKQAMVHVLVARLFLPNPDNKPTVNHKNGSKTDNRAVNLEWATCRENMAHAVNLNLVNNSGERNGRAKLTELEAIAIYDSADRAATISKRFNVSTGAVNDIKAGRRWVHIKVTKSRVCRPHLTTKFKLKYELKKGV